MEINILFPVLNEHLRLERGIRRTMEYCRKNMTVPYHLTILDNGSDDDTPEIDDHLARLPLAIRVYEITGPLFFGASDAIEHIVVKDFTKCLILRMRSVPALDSTALNALKDLVDTCEKKGITILFSHVNEQPMKVMKKAGFIELVGKEHFCPNIAAALKHAEDCID